MSSKPWHIYTLLPFIYTHTHIHTHSTKLLRVQTEWRLRLGHRVGSGSLDANQIPQQSSSQNAWYQNFPGAAPELLEASSEESSKSQKGVLGTIKVMLMEPIGVGALLLEVQLHIPQLQKSHKAALRAISTSTEETEAQRGLLCEQG